MKNVSINDLLTESDVEQKFIYPILTSPYPTGLGLNTSDFRTKISIRKIKIGKGTSSKIYFPDYLIVIDGLPLVVIEVKKVDEDLEEALREARLYANEINVSYQRKINPCQILIASNGKETLLSYWDSDSVKTNFRLEESDISNESFYVFLETCKKERLLQIAKDIKGSIRKDTKFSRPTSLLGSVQHAIVGDNSFGSNLALEYRYLFNPTTLDERVKIAQNAYVESKRRLSHVKPIDKLIRGVVTRTNTSNIGISLESTENPQELIKSLQDRRKIAHQVILLVGSVGSGKSTFIDYLREVAIPPDLKESTFWLSVDLNNAPSSKDSIYNWLLSYCIEYIENSNEGKDIKTLETWKKIFAKELADFNQLAKLINDETLYNIKLFDKLQDLLADKPKYLKNLTDYLFQTRRKTLLIVLDNADKKDKDTQLLMFEVANWLKSTFNCTVFLPIRNITFDHYRNSPPLDTVIKDLVFKIDPPLLENVIYERFRFFIRELENRTSTFTYFAGNYRVECKKEEVKNYLSSILTTLFENTFFERLIVGLAGRDIRKGLEIFLDFCKSGHITEEIILKMRMSKGKEYKLPNHLVTRVLLRGNKRYFSDGNSRVKNIFFSHADESIPDPFVRLSILRWLFNRKSTSIIRDLKGYHKIEFLVQDLISTGHSEKRIFEELESLFDAGCIITESQSIDFNINNLVCISVSGIIHLELLTNIDYLSSIAEDTWFKRLDTAKQIADNISSVKISEHLNKENSISNSTLLLDYLEDYKNYFPFLPSNFLESDKIEDLKDLSKSIDFVRHIRENNSVVFRMETKYPIGSEHDGQVVKVMRHGIFVEFGLDAVGYIKIENLTNQPNLFFTDKEFDIGDILNVVVLGYREDHHRFELKLV